MVQGQRPDRPDVSMEDKVLDAKFNLAQEHLGFDNLSLVVVAVEDSSGKLSEQFSGSCPDSQDSGT